MCGDGPPRGQAQCSTPTGPQCVPSRPPRRHCLCLRTVAKPHVAPHAAPSCTQVVAAVGDKLVSVFDGSTTYSLGKWTHARQGAASRTPLYACLYAYATPHEVLPPAICMPVRLQKLLNETPLLRGPLPPAPLIMHSSLYAYAMPTR